MVSEYPRTKAVRESPTRQALDSAPCHLLVLFRSCPKLALSRLGWAGVAQSLSPVTLNTDSHSPSRKENLLGMGWTAKEKGTIAAQEVTASLSLKKKKKKKW